MGSIFSPNRIDLEMPPPPHFDSRWKEKDQFGFPKYRPSLRSEWPVERATRIESAKNLVAESLKMLETQIGVREARLFLRELSKLPQSYGKKEDRSKTYQLLKMYDERVTESSEHIKAIPGRLAKELWRRGARFCTVEAYEKRIRRAVSERERGRKTEEERGRRHSSLLSSADTSKRDK